MQFFTQKSLGLRTGLQLHQNFYGELGLGVKSAKYGMHHPFASAYGGAVEFKINDIKSNPIVGLKAWGWAAGGASAIFMSVNVVDYTNFNEHSVRLRPEIGIGADVFQMYYGYNFTFYNNEMNGVNTHLFGLSFLIDLKEIGREKVQFD